MHTRPLGLVKRTAGLVAAALLAVTLVPPVSVRAEGLCPSTPVAAITLPHLRAALDNGDEGLVVALGSSSTQGSAATDIAHSYPAVLQAALAAGLPRGHVAIINRGIGGQDAAEELARLDTDVLAVRPQLVIWQVGANGALRASDPAQFRQMVLQGVRRMQAAGADVILMDNQRSPRLLASASEPIFDEILADVAAETKASLFSRRSLMLAWANAGAPAALFSASDGMHHNDRGYHCVAHSLAHAILDGLHGRLPLTASR